MYADRRELLVFRAFSAVSQRVEMVFRHAEGSVQLLHAAPFWRITRKNAGRATIYAETAKQLCKFCKIILAIFDRWVYNGTNPMCGAESTRFFRAATGSTQREEDCT